MLRERVRKGGCVSRRLVGWLDGWACMYVCVFVRITYLAGRRKCKCVLMLAWLMTDRRMLIERLG